MAFDGAHWLPVARKCAAPLDGVDEQASLRTAIGRAYYAPLMMIKGRVEAVQGVGTFPDAGSHAKVLAALRNSRIAVFQKVEARLKILKAQREKADYDLDLVPDAEDVEEALDRSRRLVEDLLPAIPNKNYGSLSFL